MKSDIPPKYPVRQGMPKIKLKWSETLRYAGPYPEKSKQFFRMETLQRALEKKLEEKDYFLYRSFKESLDGKTPDSLAVDLIYENKSRLIFSLLIGSRQGKRAMLYLVMAKNHEEFSAALEQEYAAFQAPGMSGHNGFIPILRQGLIYLPDRHQRRDINRELFAWLFRLPGEWTPLYVASSTQWGPRGSEVRRFTVQETEKIKCELIRHLAAAYDPDQLEGVTPRQLSSDDLWVKKNKDRSFSLAIVSCRRRDKKLRPGQFIASLLFGSFGAGQNRLPLAPARPENFRDALMKALPADHAAALLAAFFRQRSMHEKKLTPELKQLLPGADYLDALESCLHP